MSIDLSKAKLGDKFITKEGRILTLAYQGRKYTLIGRGCFVRLNQNGKLNEDNEESKFDLIEQFFDNGDILDIGERGEVLAEMTKSEYEKAKELGIDFLQVYIEKNPEEKDPEEDKRDFNRRLEVVVLAEKLVTNELFAVTNHIHDMRELGAAINLDSPTEYAFLIAEEFVNNKSKYLENGKLC